jgi:hypothetical protein
MCILAMIVAMATRSYFDPTLAIWLNQAYGIKEKDNGLFFGLVPLFYALTSSQIGKITARMQRRVAIFFGFLIGCIGLLCVGPS